MLCTVTKNVKGCKNWEDVPPLNKSTSWPLLWRGINFPRWSNSYAFLRILTQPVAIPHSKDLLWNKWKHVLYFPTIYYLSGLQVCVTPDGNASTFCHHQYHHHLHHCPPHGHHLAFCLQCPTPCDICEKTFLEDNCWSPTWEVFIPAGEKLLRLYSCSQPPQPQPRHASTTHITQRSRPRLGKY